MQRLVDGVQTDTDCLDLAGAPGDFVGNHDHAGAWLPDPDRIRAVRLDLCRPQHSAADQRSAAFDAAIVRRRSGNENLPHPPAGRDHGDGEFAGDFPRKHDGSPCAGRRAGQGPHCQGRARLPHGSPDHRIRGGCAHRARRTAIVGQFHAGHGAKHVGHRGPIQRAGQRRGVRRRGNLRQRPDGIVGHRRTGVVDLRNRPPGDEFGANCPQGCRRSGPDRRHHARSCRQCRPHQRRGRLDPDHCFADQPARAQRHHRSRARRRSRSADLPWSRPR